MESSRLKAEIRHYFLSNSAQGTFVQKSGLRSFDFIMPEEVNRASQEKWIYENLSK